MKTQTRMSPERAAKFFARMRNGSGVPENKFPRPKPDKSKIGGVGGEDYDTGQRRKALHFHIHPRGIL